MDNAKALLGKVHGVNVTDNTAAILRAGSLSVCRMLYEMGHDPVMQVTCRDRNRLAIQSDLLSAHILGIRSEEHTSELQSRLHLVCRLLLEKKKPDRVRHDVVRRPHAGAGH